MTDEYLTEFYDFADHAASYGSDHLSSEERHLESLRNLALSKAAKERKKRKKQTAEPAERKITEAERRALEQARIREERQTRGARSEENRRLAAIRAAKPQYEADSPQPKDAPPPAEAPQEADIDIALPSERKEKRADVKSKQKKTKNTKQPEKEKPKRAAAASRYVKRSAASSNPNRITTGGAVTLGILTGVLIGTVIYGRVQTNEVYTEIAALQAEYDDLVARNISMKSEMESKMTVKNIEEYATDVLGLMPLDQSQIEYIRLQTEDAVVISEPEDNFFVLVNDYFVGIWEFLRGK